LEEICLTAWTTLKTSKVLEPFWGMQSTRIPRVDDFLFEHRKRSLPSLPLKQVTSWAVGYNLGDRM
jgi:hypothetical protein